MSFFGDMFSNPFAPITDTWNTLASLPGTPEAFGTGVYGGLEGDLSWNPYSQDNSVWDTGAGGTELSKDPKNRATGRAIGTAIGAAFTGGALGAMAEGGGAAGAGVGATEGAVDYSLASGAGNALGDYAGSTASLGTGAGATGGTAGGASLGTGAGGYAGATGGLASQVGNGAIRGSISNAGSTAAQGGNSNDIFKSGLYGGLYGGAGAGINYGVSSYNPGSYVTDNAAGQQVINKGVQGGLNAGLQGKNIGQGALSGAAIPGMNMAGNYLGNSYNNYTNSDMPDLGTLGGTMSDSFGENSASMGGYNSTAQMQANETPGVTEQVAANGNPLKRAMGYGGTSAAASPSATTDASPFVSATGNGTQSSGPAYGNMAGSLLGLYSAYQQHKRNSDLANGLQSMYGQNSPYAQQLNQALLRQQAASGRRSDVGGRQVELQARLADLNSRNAPMINSLNNNNNNGTNAMLNNLYNIGNQSGAFSAIGRQAQPWLNSVFASPMGRPNVGPQLGDE